MAEFEAGGGRGDFADADALEGVVMSWMSLKPRSADLEESEWPSLKLAVAERPLLTLMP